MADTSSKASARYPQLLAYLAERLAAALAEKGIAPEIARSSAEEAVDSVRATFGGEILYIPSGYHFRLERRNAEICRRLAMGESRNAIRVEFDLSDMQLRRIQSQRGS